MSDRRDLLLGVASVLLLGVLTAAPAQAAVVSPAPQEADATGGIGLRLLDAPTEAADDARARLYIVDHLAPGTHIERRIEVSNATDSAETVALYAAGASIDDGTFVGTSGKTANELSSWTTVTPARSDIPAGETLIATVDIDVAIDAAPGERYGVVWAEVRSDQRDDRRGVVQVSRVGIRLYVSVGPGGAPAPDFTIASLIAKRSSQGQPAVSAVVHNTGGRALDMSGTLQLSDGPGALSAGPFPAELGRTLAIGDTQTVTVTLDAAVPDGPWDAHLKLRSGRIEREAEATITFPRPGGLAAPVAIAEPDNRSWLGLVAAVGLVLLVLVALAVVVIRRRRCLTRNLM
ncbi:MAG: hypothetical protein U5K30_03440 [Acidimicrobiales bacterium]|nr:hypothetical protein [Acidimicrobiales bacterium]